MRSLTLTGGRVELTERSRPDLGNSRDVRVRVVVSGICGTDRSIVIGHFSAEDGVVLGHEAVGVVEAIGDEVEHLAVGDRVVINPTLYCSRCDACLRGATNRCRNRVNTEVGIDRDGTFAEEVVLPAQFVHRIPVGMSFQDAALIEPLACVLNNVEAAGITWDDDVLVVGGGPIGQLAAEIVAPRARSMTLLESDAYRRDAAAKRFGASTNVSIAGDLLEMPDGKPTAIIDTTGAMTSTAVALVDDDGTVVVMGYAGTEPIGVTGRELALRGVRIVGSGAYTARTFAEAIALAARLELRWLVTHELPLDRWKDAFDLLQPGRDGYAALKVLLRPNVDG